MGELFKKPWLVIIIVSLMISVAILIEGGVDFSINTDRPTEKENGEEHRTVVRVEDITFSYLELQNLLNQVKGQAEFEEREISEEEAQQEALDMLIDQGVLIKYAESRGLDPSQEDINNRFNEIITGYGMSEEDFLSQLAQDGISSRDEVDSLIRHELAVSALFDIYIEEIEVSDDDISNYYEEYIEELVSMGLGEDELPGLEEVEEFMRSNIVYEIAIEKLTQKAREIRGDFDIEIML